MIIVFSFLHSSFLSIHVLCWLYWQKKRKQEKSFLPILPTKGAKLPWRMSKRGKEKKANDFDWVISLSFSSRRISTSLFLWKLCIGLPVAVTDEHCCTLEIRTPRRGSTVGVRLRFYSLFFRFVSLGPRWSRWGLFLTKVHFRVTNQQVIEMIVRWC